MSAQEQQQQQQKVTRTHQVRCKTHSAEFLKLKARKSADEDESATLDEQIRIENLVTSCYGDFLKRLNGNQDVPSLNREAHIKYLIKGLSNLPSNFECLDASRPWICYWILHPLYLMDVKLGDELVDSVIDFLNRCQCETGGFAGGPGQLAHLAPTYAAVNALVSLDCDRALKIIRRKELTAWINRLKHPNGAMRMHEDGEEDLRGTYCAVSVGKLTNLEEIDPHLFEGVGEWVARCQTYEGGFGACPDVEAHGGYTFCGVAALKLLGKECLMDVDTLLYWLVNKQMKFEGGFQGRTNKLVDSCYSFWQGGQFPIIHSILAAQDNTLKDSSGWLFNQSALQEYILLCCQSPHGGLIDKPEKGRDYYHSCYSLSGLSISQYFNETVTNICNYEDSLLNPTHPLFNVSTKGVMRANFFFQDQH